jgi:hypothetical protein
MDCRSYDGDDEIGGAKSAMALERLCKGCGGETTVTIGVDCQSFECCACHFVLIEAIEGAAKDAADESKAHSVG